MTPRRPLRFEPLEPRRVLDGLIFSEIMAINDSAWADVDGAFSDWIEIHNPTAAAVDLEDWYLKDSSAAWQFPDVTIEPNDYLLVFASDKNRRDPAAELHTNFRLKGIGEYLGLLHSDGSTVEFEFNAYPPQYSNVSYGFGSDLLAPGYFTAWTPGSPNLGEPVADPTADVIISEIMYHPQSENVLEEYIELYNRGIATVTLDGWQISDGVQFTFPDLDPFASETTLNPGEYLVVASEWGTFTLKYPAVTNVVGGWTGRLSNRSEDIELDDAAGNRIDRVQYADQGDWGRRERGPLDEGHQGWIWTADHDGLGKSLELINRAMSNDYGQNWAPSIPAEGTPGVANSVAEGDIAPMILDVSHFPTIPRSSEPVTVTARLSDEVTAGVAAIVYYRDDGAGAFSALAMRDDGQSGDADAADGVYGAVLPARVDQTVVEFYVRAVDAAANARTYPGPAVPDGQVTNLLYQVDDSFDADAPWNPQNQPLYYLIMTEAERAELAYIGDGANGDQWSNAQMNATFVSVDGIDLWSEDLLDTKVRYTVGIRNRGNASRGWPPNNYRVNFVHDRPWRDVTAVNINSKYTHLQLLGHTLFRMAGLPAEDSLPVQVRVNGQNLAGSGVLMYGSYVHLEAYDSDFANHQFPDDASGNVYRAVSLSHNARLDYLGIDPQAYINAGYKKNTNASENDWSDLIELTYVLNNTPDATYVEEVKRVVNVDQWLQWLAIQALIANGETNLGNGVGDDYSLYCGVEDPRFVLLPHDLDTILGTGGSAGLNDSIYRATALPSVRRFLTHPAFAGRYHAALIELIETVFSAEQFNPLVDQVLGYHVPASVIDQIKQWVVDRKANVLAQIPQDFSITPNLPTVDGYAYTNFPATDLGGTAHAAETGSVLVNRQLADWDPINAAWSIGEPEAGETDLILPRGSTWRYLDNGSDQGTVWRAADFDDSTWSEGPAELGYGDGDEVTVIDYGGDPANKHMTSYFRRSFEVTDASPYASLLVQLLRDDGAVVYLNGQELFRDNMPAGDVNYQTAAASFTSMTSSPSEFEFVDHYIGGALLIDGTNVLAVEVHQAAVNSADVSFNLELYGVLPSVATAIPLNPGINRIFVETFVGPEGTGNRLRNQFVDVWYDTGANNEISGGTITEDTILSPNDGPYLIRGNVVVDTGATLTILPGTTVFFDADTSLAINGRLLAEGTEDELIRFTRWPGGGNWDGLQFLGTMEDNRIAYAVLEYGVTNNGMLGVVNSNLSIDHATFDHTDRRRIRSVDSWLIVRNSTFVDIFPGAMAPTTDNYSEHIWGSAPYGGGHFIIENNLFGTVKGHNDAVDVNGGFLADGDPAMQIIGNVFLGTGDDCLDLEGDAYIEGNVFMHNREDQWNTSSGHAQVIAAGSGHEFFVLRNVFYDVDYVAQVKQGSFMTFENNTVVDTAEVAIYFLQPGQTYYGRGAYLDGNIFVNTPVVFADMEPTTELTVNRSILPGEYHDYGTGNLDEDPRLADTAGGDFSLGPGSPAVGAGPNGLDMGAMVYDGVSIAGEPPVLTGNTDDVLTFGGPGITHFKLRFNDGPWSIEVPIDTSIPLSALADRTYTVSAIGKNTAGVWQDESAATISKTWTVDTNFTRVRINEVLAINAQAVDHEGTFPDMIELVNDGASAADLSGMSLSDEPAAAVRFVFPGGTTLGPGEYLVVYADSDVTTSGFHLGFALQRGGEGVFLYEAAANGGAMIDSVEFGPQVPDLSIGRVGHDGDWALTQPSFGGANVLQRTGDPSTLKINEWLTDEEVLFADDFIELYNPDPLPVPLSDLYLSDHLVAQRDKHRIAPLSFVAGSGFVALVADDDVTAGPNHVDFKLSPIQEIINLWSADLPALHDADLREIDKVIYYPQTTNVSQGRSGDGAESYAFFPLPTPGVSNPMPEFLTAGLIAIDDVWAYNQSGANLGTGWRASGYNDSAWPAGAALLYVEADPLPAPKNTPLGLGPITFYFRKHFTLDTDPAGVTQLEISTVIDDAAVIYLNGVEVYRLGMAAGAFDYQTLAGRGIGNAAYEGPFAIPTGALLAGDNVIAVEVHQASAGSSDVVFGLTLDATVTTTNEGPIAKGLDLIAGLRITEMMYHPTGSGSAEFIELQNVSGTTLDLDGVRLTEGIDFTFPAMTLAPDEYVVVVRDPAAFESRYGPALNVAGQYTGGLSNGGEDVTLKLALPLEAAILRFDYNDTWEASTDGGGYALQIIDPTDEPASWDMSASWTAGLPTPGTSDVTSVVVDRQIFYNNSAWDDPGRGRTDDDAIATDKTALMGGETAGFANYTSYVRGINGIMIDVLGLRNLDQLDATDFSFRVGNNDNPLEWSLLASSPTVTVRPGAAPDDPDRVVLVWDDHAIEGQWLEVAVAADARTGLSSEDVFSFGNAIGETGNSDVDAKVDAWDVLATRNNPHSFWNPALIDTNYDFDRDGRVDAVDTLIARNQRTWAMTELQLIDLAPKQWVVGSGQLPIINQQSSIINLRAISPAALAWLYEFEQMDTQSKRAHPAEEVVDLLWASL